MYSGDITNAPNGAAEYLYAKDGLKEPTLIKKNIYSGQTNCTYKIIVGKGENINYNYMINPNNLFVETKCESVQRQTILGMLLPERDQQSFVILNLGAGSARVSGNSELSYLATRALHQQWSNTMTLKEMIIELGGIIVQNENEADYNFALDNLQKDSIIKVFTENKTSM